MSGRHVIYGKREEYEKFKKSDDINWRFVSYDPALDGRLDFSWEREWRIKKEDLILDPNNVKLVFPNFQWVDRFIKDHEKDYHTNEDGYCKECFCTRKATVLNYSDFMSREKCENLSGTCPDPDMFPWVLINLNEKIIGRYNV
ncbi:MAG: hypothetical protein H6571_09815 [Lewinellaceae bacterium]|nr:hypothetical protein [Lewinellaceae bacterium]